VHSVASFARSSLSQFSEASSRYETSAKSSAKNVPKFVSAESFFATPVFA
jgi:hypothetical protein